MSGDGDGEPGATGGDVPDADDEAIEQIRNSPCKIDEIEVSPRQALQTRLHLILREFRKAREASSLQDVYRQTLRACSNLDDLGVFKDVDATLTPGLLTKPGTCNVDLQLVERAWYAFNIGTHVSLEGALTGSAVGVLRNLTGNCEHHSLSVSLASPKNEMSSPKHTDLAYRLRFPRIYAYPVHAQVTLHSQHDNQQMASSYKEQMRGGSLDFITSDGCHKVGYEFGWLQLTDPTVGLASDSVRKSIGDHVKSALHYTFLWDQRTRDSGQLPLLGHATRVDTELSGLTPDSNPLQFVRARLDYQHAMPLSNTASLAVDVALGALVPIMGCAARHDPTLIRERFFLGGVASLRGFQEKGVGPCEARRSDSKAPISEGKAAAPGMDALGGDMFASVRTSVTFPLPGEFLKQVGLQGTLFTDTGSITSISGKTSIADGLEKFWNEWRLSLGVGIKLPLGRAGHLQMNFVQCLKSFDTDQLAAGFQFGFSAEPYVHVQPRNL